LWEHSTCSEMALSTRQTTNQSTNQRANRGQSRHSCITVSLGRHLKIQLWMRLC